MSDAINEDVEFQKKIYRKKLFFFWKKMLYYTQSGNRLSDDRLLLKSRVEWDMKNTTRSWCIYERFDR